ncbi:hypothetical protein C0J52_00697 [Blattella germanica]|nr:hypothetical protein C0J52_00697 [Blattella germanica]
MHDDASKCLKDEKYHAAFHAMEETLMFVKGSWPLLILLPKQIFFKQKGIDIKIFYFIFPKKKKNCVQKLNGNDYL